MKKLLQQKFPAIWRGVVAVRWWPYWFWRNHLAGDRLARMLFPRRFKRKAETDFWAGVYERVCAGAATAEEKAAACVHNSHEDSFVRYQKYLYLRPDSFRGMKVVDVGCGPTCGLIGFEDCEKYGVDHLVDEYKAIGFPLDRHGIQYRNARLEETGLPGGEFDRVLCVNALDHVDDVRACVREIGRLLKPGGEFLAQIGFHDKPTPTEPHVMRHDQLLKWARQQGMRPLEIRLIDQSAYLGEFRYFYRLVKSAR